ncbi:MAG TPA: response regulator transcription factor [Solirubrobacteraceae bacterium]|nr:response regulator transcription factor [Solirubrobacteraceae bacterium]
MRVLIADDQLLILNGVRSALENAEDIEVVGATQRGEQVAALVDAERPDLVLLDHEMAGTQGVACVRRIKQSHPDVKVVTLSASEDSQRIAEALAAGADAYIGKRINPDDLPSALRQVVAGVVYYSGPACGAAAPRAADGDALTQRELTMLEAISRGLSTKAISRELWISEKTVKFHLTNIYRKLGVHNRAGAMRYAYDHDLIAEPRLPVVAAVASA